MNTKAMSIIPNVIIGLSFIAASFFIFSLYGVQWWYLVVLICWAISEVVYRIYRYRFAKD